MKYVSTRGQAPILNFEEALLVGLASDGGLYMPATWPHIPPDFIADCQDKSYADIAYQVLRLFLADTPQEADLQALIDKAYAAFDNSQIAPLVSLGTDKAGYPHYLLELFHGPTYAFKDIAMQLLAQFMSHILARRGQPISIIGATSGDTGGAAIEALRGRDMINVFILYPKDRVSDIQRKQMTTPQEENIHVIAIDGTFDDCQSLVKALFNDKDLRAKANLTGVNSINWARIMAQMVYYFTAAAALAAELGKEQKLAFCVPTGNFGDIFAGFAAKQMGLPIKRLMIATNENDILARTLQTGVYALGDVVATSSPSMDIQRSSNFERLIFEACGRDADCVRDLMAELAKKGQFTLPADALSFIREDFVALRIDEAHMATTMAQIYTDKGMMLDPHSAVGVAAAQSADMVKDLPANTPIISLATAHPAKFPTAVEKACGVPPPMPPRLANLLDKPERAIDMPNNIARVADYINSHI
ncbi:MAG: threonine synthase [Alphaproteobacteria bacterium]|nr:threonine synthase [Alphaproteobacteria bacterium]